MSAIATDVFPSDNGEGAVPSKVKKLRFLSMPVGRVGLITYYARSMKAMLVMFVLTIPAVAIPQYMKYMQASVGNTFEPSPIVTVVAAALFVIGTIGLVIYYVRLMIYRLHDLDLSAWFGLLMLIPIVGSIFGMYVALVPGKKADNRFGAWRAPTRSDKVFGIIGLVVFAAFIGLTVWGYINTL